jgi:hypothetical protein
VQLNRPDLPPLQLCKRLALAAEPALQRECGRHRWQQPRRPRGQAARPRAFPWRSLYHQHACRACSTAGEFPVRRCAATGSCASRAPAAAPWDRMLLPRGLASERCWPAATRPGTARPKPRRTPAGPMEFLLCKRCLGRAEVQGRLAAGNQRVDLLGISGKRLISDKADKKGLKYKWAAWAAWPWRLPGAGWAAGWAAAGGNGWMWLDGWRLCAAAVRAACGAASRRAARLALPPTRPPATARPQVDGRPGGHLRGRDLGARRRRGQEALGGGCAAARRVGSGRRQGGGAGPVWMHGAVWG